MLAERLKGQEERSCVSTGSVSGAPLGGHPWHSPREFIRSYMACASRLAGTQGRFRVRAVIVLRRCKTQLRTFDSLAGFLGGM